MALEVLFLGSNCDYSRILLESMIDARLKIVAVWLAGQNLPGLATGTTIKPLLPPDAAIADNDPNSFPVTSTFVQKNILQTTWDNALPLYGIQRVKAQETAHILRSLAPSLAIVACFPRLIPPSLLTVPRHGFLNVHPSMLPSYRGPAPLFWQFRAGEQHTGITVHWMDSMFDTGAIAAQRIVPLPDGILESDATQVMARAGGRILADVMHHITNGELPYHKQPPGGSYQPWPHADDFAISTDWAARHIFNFMRATVVWGYPFILEIEGRRWLLSDALTWSNYTTLEQQYTVNGDIITFRCMPGMVQARLSPENG